MSSRWLFQTHSWNFNLEHTLRSRAIGDHDEWAVMDRFAEDVRPGDGVLLYQQGRNPGVYAVGEVIASAGGERRIAALRHRQR